MGEGVEDEEVDEDGNDGGDAAAPPVVVAPPLAPAPPIVTTPEKVVEVEDPMEMVPKQEVLVAHEFILADPEPKLSWLNFYHTLMRDSEESPSRMMDDFDDLDDPNESRSNMGDWFP
jgi:hypothetical protein